MGRGSAPGGNATGGRRAPACHSWRAEHVRWAGRPGDRFLRRVSWCEDGFNPRLPGTPDAYAAGCRAVRARVERPDRRSAHATLCRGAPPRPCGTGGRHLCAPEARGPRPVIPSRTTRPRPPPSPRRCGAGPRVSAITDLGSPSAVRSAASDPALRPRCAVRDRGREAGPVTCGPGRSGCPFRGGSPAPPTGCGEERFEPADTVLCAPCAMRAADRRRLTTDAESRNFQAPEPSPGADPPRGRDEPRRPSSRPTARGPTRYRSSTPSNRRGSPSGLSSRSSSGSSASGTPWYATGRNQRSMAVPPTDVDVDVVAG
ncbi:hypothetical protein EV562_11781 [Streptomyces sp. BK208]|nr:hypothetical protein EV562_11781 [Streptomyces sp. BK208]